MKRELVESYFDWNEIRLEAYLRIDPELIELEGECEKTMDELEPYIEQYGHEFWTLIDRIVSGTSPQRCWTGDVAGIGQNYLSEECHGRTCGKRNVYPWISGL